MRWSVLAVIVALSGIGAFSHGDAPRDSPPPGGAGAFEELKRFFEGYWQCAGRFTNGKEIASSESFASVLQGAWLLQVHDDQPPFPYHAYSLWGEDKQSHDLIVTNHDVTGGMRLLRSASWHSPVITLEAAPVLAQPGFNERFTYERRAAGLFSVEYATLRSSGQWVLVDRLDCRKIAEPAGDK